MTKEQRLQLDVAWANRAHLRAESYRLRKESKKLLAEARLHHKMAEKTWRLMIQSLLGNIDITYQDKHKDVAIVDGETFTEWRLTHPVVKRKRIPKITEKSFSVSVAQQPRS